MVLLPGRIVLVLTVYLNKGRAKLEYFGFGG